MTENEKLSEAEMEFIRKTWGTVGNSIEMAIDFYNRLFYLYPELRPLFKEDIRLQARKFTAHMFYLVKNVDNWASIQNDIQDLGRRHHSYEVKSQHYDFVREALFFAMKEHLREGWNTAVEVAWVKFYAMVASRMMQFHHTKGEHA
jgi:hemoglobin-like flavoprotein